MTTLLTIDPVFTEHDAGSLPESAERIRVLGNRLTETGLIDRCQPGRIREITARKLERVHPAEYRVELQEACANDVGWIIPDVHVGPESERVARTAAGSVLAAVEDVLAARVSQALCLVRPPGHHARRESVMGFCLYANVALAVEHALQSAGLSRVLVVDWDVHHGNGTQEIFYDREEVTFFSAHRFPFYPGSGSAEETGSGPGLGSTFNLPIEYGTPREVYRDRFAGMLRDAAAKSRPELVVISAGFDAHHRDPVGDLGLEAEDFAWLTETVAETAREYCGGRLVSVLEGGYDLEALADSVEAHLRTLLEVK